MNDVLRADHLVREIGGPASDVRTVDDVSFAIQRGEIVALVGPSGAGKSSLLRLLNRLDEPTSGTVYLDGVDYRSIDPQTLRRRVGMVMQTARMFPGTVGDNIAYGPHLRGETLTAQRIAEICTRVGLDGYADRQAATLSGGEAQRVSLARTMANGPDVVLLDEPTSALDERIKVEIEDTLRTVLADRELACLIITHDAAQARRLAHRALVMKNGRLVADGPLDGKTIEAAIADA